MFRVSCGCWRHVPTDRAAAEGRGACSGQCSHGSWGKSGLQGSNPNPRVHPWHHWMTLRRSSLLPAWLSSSGKEAHENWLLLPGIWGLADQSLDRLLNMWTDPTTAPGSRAHMGLTLFTLTLSKGSNFFNLLPLSIAHHCRAVRDNQILHQAMPPGRLTVSPSLTCQQPSTQCIVLMQQLPPEYHPWRITVTIFQWLSAPMLTAAQLSTAKS